MSADLGLPPKHATLTRSYSSPDVHPHDQNHVKPRPPPFNHRSSSLPSSPPESPKAVHEAPPVDVFLGGSCNPTTWRRDIAIPLLEAANITYYNPQVDEWYEELIELESRAKDTASFVLFVIDNLTRSIVSMNEAAEFMCCGRRVVLVVEDMPLEDVVLEGTTISAHEISDLNAARACLRHFSRHYPQTTLCRSVADAIAVIQHHLDANSPSPFFLRSYRLRKRSSVILSQMKAKNFSLQRSSSSSSVHEFDSASDDESGDTPPPSKKLVYLGGNITNTHWRATFAIPMLQKAGLPYYSPRGDFQSYSSRSRSHEELKADKLMKHKAALLLIVIPSNCRSIASMIDTIGLICSGRAVILVIEPMQEGMPMEDGSLVWGREFKDLRRARLYLEETAQRHDINIYSCVDNAVQAIIDKAKKAH